MRSKIALICFLSPAMFGQLSWQGQPNGDLAILVRPSDLYSGHAFTGMAYSAERVSERVLTLADGTHIRDPRRVEKNWRDSQGRTRIERSVTLGPGQANKFLLIEIRDPVAGFYYVLDDQNKVAHRLTLQAAPAEQRTEAPKALPASTPRPETKWEKLGTQSIEGLITEGMRASTTWPVDAFGNDRPLTSTFERWDSTELKVLVLSKNFDPRAGEEIIRLNGVSRAEPDAALFAPPENYMIADEKETFTIASKRQ